MTQEFNFPVHAHIEPSTLCNLRCVSCPNIFLPPERKGVMSLDRFREILDKMLFLKDISLLGLGEPLINPDLLNMAREARMRGITARTVTNGMLLNKIDLESLVGYFDEFVISFVQTNEQTEKGGFQCINTKKPIIRVNLQ
ncbi:MAG: radical SAM protein [Clostridia bacterium]|nr:radical SAM protein [Clostridia bacterium]